MRWTQLAGKEIIDITSARRLGSVADADLVFDPVSGRIHELRVASRRPGLLGWRARVTVVPWSAVRRIGEDLVLVELPAADAPAGAADARPGGPGTALPRMGTGERAQASTGRPATGARKGETRLPKTVIGSFDSRQDAEQAVVALKRRGVKDDDISLVSRDDRQRTRDDGQGASMSNRSVGDGAAWGAGIGAGAGLLASAGALAIPGIGPLIAAGPLAATLSGAAAGGLAGGLMDWGIPEQEARDFETKVKQGKTLCAVRCDDRQVDAVAEILRQHGARDVKTHQAAR